MTNKDYYREVGARIRFARGEIGITQGALAKAAGKTRGSISKWERGLTAPSIECLRGVCSALCVTADWLLGGEE